MKSHRKHAWLLLGMLLLLAAAIATTASVRADADEVTPHGPVPLATLGCSVEGNVLLQRADPPGVSSWETGLRVVVFPAGQQEPVETSTLSTDAQGIFYFYVTHPGVYDIGIKSDTALENRRYGVTIQEGFNPGVAFGTLLEGDANDSNGVDTADYALVEGAFWGSGGATDFNRDGITDILDYSLLYDHYGLAGPRPVDARPNVAKAQSSTTQLQVGSAVVQVGEVFEVPILVTPGGELDGAEAHLSFDPSVLRVVDGAGGETDRIIAGEDLPQVIRNLASNSTGRIDYAAGAGLGSAPLSAPLELARVRLRAIAPSSGTTISWRSAIACRGGTAHTIQTVSGQVQVLSPTATPTRTTTGVPTATPTPVPTCTPTGTATDVPSVTPTTVPSGTSTATPTQTSTPTYTPTHTPTETHAPTATPTPSPSGTVAPSPTPGSQTLFLPLVQNEEEEPTCAECTRFGVNVLGSITAYEVQQLGGIGWYQNWGSRAHPARPGGAEFVQLIRLRDDPSQPAYDYWPPDWDHLATVIAANPGALWLVGNEPDVESQDNCTPAEYAARYHACYTFIKERDPLAQVSAAGIVYPTELRLRWLDLVLETYQAAYGESLPVDVWNIHVQILPERRGGWGCQIPPGLPDDLGEDHQVADNVSVPIFREKIVAFRTWMRARGYQDRPLILSEYGVLMPSGYGYLGGRDVAQGDQMVKDFMTGTFDYMLEAVDAELGCPTDGNRLVQRWAWYSLNDRMADFTLDPPYLGFNGSLFVWNSPYPGTLTAFGTHFRDYLTALRAGS